MNVVKKVLFLILIYILATLFLTALLACFFTLYPIPLPESTLISPSLHNIDVFVYSSLALLPFVSVLSLTAILLRLIKSGSRTTPEFLSYVFLCFVVWLIIIPACIFYRPEQKLSMRIHGQSLSPASVFFETESVRSLAKNVEGAYLAPPEISIEILSGLLFLRDMGRSAGSEGRATYLLFASMGLALAALYALCSISEWKLINVAIVLLAFYGIVWFNVEIYKRNWDFAFDAKWLALIINGSLFFVMLFIGTALSAVQRKVRKEAR